MANDYKAKNKTTLITELPISKRLKEALIGLSFKTLEELKDLEEVELENIGGIGYKSINELKDFLENNNIEMQKEIEVKQEELEKQEEDNLQEKSSALNLRGYMEKEIPERELFVIYNRVGIYGSEKTLEELGEIMGGITRERVRQIESRGIGMLRDAYNLGVLKDSLIEKFKDYGNKASFFSEIDLGNKAYPKNSLLEILLNMFADEYETIQNSKLGEDKILSPKKMDLEKRLTELLIELSETDSLKDIKGLSDKYKVPVHIVQGIEDLEIFSNGTVGLKSNKNIFYQGVTGKIYVALKESGRPLKIKEICKKANLSHNQVRGAMERVPDAVNVGLSTYALKEWGYIEGFIPDVAVYYLNEANQPMSLKKLTSLILKQRIVKEGSVYAGLSNDDRLVLLDNGYWALTEWGCENVRENNYQYKNYEVDATEALMDILNRKGEFMSMRQIFEEIKTEYGEKAPSSWPTYYNAIQKLKEAGDVTEMKKGRYCYYKVSAR